MNPEQSKLVYLFVAFVITYVIASLTTAYSHRAVGQLASGDLTPFGMIQEGGKLTTAPHFWLRLYLAYFAVTKAKEIGMVRWVLSFSYSS